MSNLFLRHAGLTPGCLEALHITPLERPFNAALRDRSLAPERDETVPSTRDRASN